MRIAVVGATGMIGSLVVGEAATREHVVTAVSRGGTSPVHSARVEPVRADGAVLHTMVELFARVDAVVAATRPAVGDEAILPAVTATLLDAAATTSRRLVVVGGAGPLLVPDEPSQLVVDAPAYVPPAYRPIASASVAQLRVCQAHQGADWTYISPPALIEPTERTGLYRRGTTTLLIDRDGTSSISAEDFAVAVVDELEAPGGERHFTVASAHGSLASPGRRLTSAGARVREPHALSTAQSS